MRCLAVRRRNGTELRHQEKRESGFIESWGVDERNVHLSFQNSIRRQLDKGVFNRMVVIGSATDTIHPTGLDVNMNLSWV